MQWTKEHFSRQVLAAEGSLYRVAVSILRNDEDCADAIQEGVLKAWQKQGSLKNEQYFKTWLTRIVINECYSILRRRKRQLPWGENPMPEAMCSDATFVDNPALQELDRLEEKYRLPILLHVIEGYSSAEIGKMLGLPDATVRTRIHRGKAMLKKRLEGDNCYE